uniref:UPAR/Ly6 domain-containing protein n=1 Tax=Poecilia latipinna TaxID=48699 RepID=A0A3B3U486_9TELE
SASVFGFCLNSSNVTCTGNDTVSFPSITSFNGFSNQGCRVNDASCNKTTTSSLLGVSYNTEITCCSTDRCNPVTPAPGTTPSATPGKQVSNFLI